MILRCFGLLMGLALYGSMVAVPVVDGAPRSDWVIPADSGRVYGQVVDAADGTPVPGAQVRLVQLGRSDMTHRDGTFHLTRVPAGRFTLVVERIGYNRETREISLEAGDSIYLRVPLHFSPIQISGVVATGAVDSRLSEDAVQATTLLGEQELVRRMEATIASTLENQAGLAAVSTGPATARPIIRGLGGDRILMLEDGERVGDLSASSPDHAVAVEPITARQIEVVRGPASLLYGSNALGGVVNVIRNDIPTSLADRPHGSVSVQGQTANRGVAGGGHVMTSVGPVALRLEGSSRTAGDLRTPLGTLANSELETHNVSAGASVIHGLGHVGGAYRFFDSSYGVPGYEGGHEHGVTVRMRRHSVRGESLLRPGSGPFRSVELDVAYNHYHHEELEHGGILGSEFGLLSASANLVARHDALGPLASGAIGIQTNWSDFAAGGSIETPPANEYAVAAFFLEEFDLSPVTLQFGARYDWRRVVPGEVDHHSDIGEIRERTFGAWSASLGALYDLGDGIALGASVGRAFRTPNASELYSEGPHLATYSFEVGNPELDAETGLGVDLFARMNRDRFKGEIAVFRNAIENYIYPRNTGAVSRTDLPVYQYVGEDVVLAGVEGSAEWRALENLVVEATASYVRGTLTRTDEPLPMIPPLNGRLGARYETPRYFVGAGWKAATRQDRVGEFETPTDGYHLFDAIAGVRWTLGGQVHTLTLRLDNLTDTVYRDHLSRIKEIMPQAGRSATLMLRANF